LIKYSQDSTSYIPRLPRNPFPRPHLVWELSALGMPFYLLGEKIGWQQKAREQNRSKEKHSDNTNWTVLQCKSALQQHKETTVQQQENDSIHH